MLSTCPRCGAQAHLPGARFCGHRGASLTGAESDLPQWQRPAPAKYDHVVMSRIAPSCPECGAPMRPGEGEVTRAIRPSFTPEQEEAGLSPFLTWPIRARPCRPRTASARAIRSGKCSGFTGEER